MSTQAVPLEPLPAPIPLDHPWLNAPPDTPISLDDPMLNAPVGERPPHIPISPLSVALDRLGLNARARRADQCGDRRFWRCDDGHTECDPRSCKLRCCRSCAWKIAEEAMERFWKNTPYMRNLKVFWICTFETNPQDTCPTREEYMAFHDDLARWAAGICDPISGTGASTYASIETRWWIDGRGKKRVSYVLAARAFCWTKQSPGMINLGYLGKSSIFCHAASELQEEIQKFFSFTPESDPVIAATIEASTARLKTVRHYGQLLRKEVLAEDERLEQEAKSLSPEELVTIESGIGTNSDPAPKSTVRCCKKCQKPMTQYTEWLPYGTKESELNSVQWYKADTPPPEG